MEVKVVADKWEADVKVEALCMLVVVEKVEVNVLAAKVCTLVAENVVTDNKEVAVMIKEEAGKLGGGGGEYAGRGKGGG